MGQFQPQIRNVFELIDKNKKSLTKNCKAGRKTKKQAQNK
ncbi:hypothetical protein ES703_22974 [subsurface metagenome]